MCVPSTPHSPSDAGSRGGAAKEEKEQQGGGVV